MKALEYKKIDAGAVALLETHDGKKFWRLRTYSYPVAEMNYPFEQFFNISELALMANKIFPEHPFTAPTSNMNVTKVDATTKRIIELGTQNSI